MSNKQNPVDEQQAHIGKVENDRNKLGDKAPTQLNQARRSPASRNDRESQGPGPNNPGAGRTSGNPGGAPRGAG